MLMLQTPNRELREVRLSLGTDVHRFNGKTIVLTGGSGFLGRWFQSFFEYANAEVLEVPCHVVAVDNHITGLPGEWREPVNGFVRLERDIIQPLDIEGRVDFIIHAAGIASPYYYRKYPLQTLDVATQGTRNVLELARTKQVEGLLYFSSSEIYGDPDARHVPTPESYRGNVSCIGPRACYDESKRIGETLCHVYHGMFGVRSRIVRPFNIYGPGMHASDFRVLPNFAARVLSRQPLHVYGAGGQTRTFCYVSDGLAGFLKVLLLGVPGEPYNIGNSSPEISMLALARLIERLRGEPIEIHPIEYPDAYPPDEPMRRCPDLTKARTQLAYEPRVDLEEGLHRFLEWASQHFERNA